MAGQARRFVRDPFHHVAVAANGVDPIIKDLEPRSVEISSLPFRRNSNADAVSYTLPERAGGGLDTGSPAVFGMTGTTAIKLTKVLDVIEADSNVASLFILRIDCLDTREMKHAIEQHRSVSNRKHEAIAIGPNRIFRVETQDIIPKVVRDGGHRHRRTGMY